MWHLGIVIDSKVAEQAKGGRATATLQTYTYTIFPCSVWSKFGMPGQPILHV